MIYRVRVIVVEKEIEIKMVDTDWLKGETVEDILFENLLESLKFIEDETKYSFLSISNNEKFWRPFIKESKELCTIYILSALVLTRDAEIEEEDILRNYQGYTVRNKYLTYDFRKYYEEIISIHKIICGIKATYEKMYLNIKSKENEINKMLEEVEQFDDLPF